MQMATCPRCGTTVKLTGSSGKYLTGKCPHCGNKVIKEK